MDTQGGHPLPLEGTPAGQAATAAERGHAAGDDAHATPLHEGTTTEADVKDGDGLHPRAQADGVDAETVLTDRLLQQVEMTRFFVAARQNALPVALHEASPVQGEARQWILANRAALVPIGYDMVPKLSYIGSLDLRTRRGSPLPLLRSEELATRGPYWLGLEELNTRGRVQFLRGALEEWGFPSAFVQREVHALVRLSLPGQPFHRADLLIVACGESPSDAETQAPGFSHSTMILRLSPPPPPAPPQPRHGNARAWSHSPARSHRSQQQE